MLGVRRWNLVASALVASVALGGPALAQGQGPSEADVSAARAIGGEGVVLAEKGDCAGAIEKLERAVRLYPAPTLTVPLGECHIKQGHLVVGTELLQRAAREEVAADAPKPFRAAQVKARQLLDRHLPRIGRLRIDVVAPSGAEFQVQDNGANVRDVLLGTERPADPGRHEIVATGPRLLSARQTVDLGEGATKTVTLQLEVDPKAPPAAVAPARQPPSGPAEPPAGEPAEADGSSPLVPLGVASLALGGAGLVVWGVTGALGLSTASDLDGVCEADGRCPTSAQPEVDALGTYGLVSTIGLIVGVVGVGAGVTLLVIDASGDEAETARGPSVQLAARPGGVSLGGRF